MNVIFMRHGRTSYNDLGLCNDDPRDPAHLSAQGREQAVAARESLASRRVQQIFVSELPRTFQTAEILNALWSVPVTPHPLLNDIRSGFNGRPVHEYQHAIAHDPLHASVNGGESLFDHKKRVLGFLEVLRDCDQHEVLVVAHEETMRVFYAVFHPVSDEEMIRLSFRNCEYFEGEV